MRLPLAAIKMSAGLFGDASAAVPEESTREERRVKLFPWDSVASQLFELFQESAIDNLTLKEIWSGAAKGNKKTAYHSHLCADITKDPCTSEQGFHRQRPFSRRLSRITRARTCNS